MSARTPTLSTVRARADELIFNDKGRAKLLADAGDYFNQISEYRED
jgi:hypothetical protein